MDARSSISRGSKRTGTLCSRAKSTISWMRGPVEPFTIKMRSSGRPARRASRTGWIPESGDIMIRVLAMSVPENTAEQTSPPMTPQEIPDKLYFRIGEVARLAGIKPYVLRFWETEFPTLGPRKSGTGHRLYRRKDVELVLEIKQLLYEKRFTIEGARKSMEARGKGDARRTAKPAKKAAVQQADLFVENPALLETVRAELR